MKPRSTLRDGKTPSTFGFACGAVQRYAVNEANRVTLEFQHGTFHIKGFENGKHFWVSHKFVRDARATFGAVRARLRLARARA